MILDMMYDIDIRYDIMDDMMYDIVCDMTFDMIVYLT